MRYGGEVVASLHLIESALSRAYSGYHRSMDRKAAATLHSMVGNHGFVDGNKRAAVLSALVFLSVNGIEELPDPKGLESVTLQVAAGETEKDELTRWIRKQVVKKK